MSISTHFVCPSLMILSTTLLAACASSGPAELSAPEPIAAAVEAVQEAEPEQVESPAGPIGGIAFPELQGSWLSSCRPMFDDEPEEGFEITRITVSGNEFNSDTSVYSDASCTEQLERGVLQIGKSFQVYAEIFRPGGSTNTVVGAAPNIDIDMKSGTIDNEPLTPEVAPFMPLEVDYNIVFVEGESAMYLGEGGETAQSRPTELDLDKRFVKQ